MSAPRLLTSAEIEVHAAIEAAATPGEWVNFQLELTEGKTLKDYVIATIDAGHPQEEFFVVGCMKPDGQYDVCHAGNGPESPHNGAFIAAARTFDPRAIATLREYRRLLEMTARLLMKYRMEVGVQAEIRRALDGAEER